MAGEEALVMISLVIILAAFLRRKRSYTQRMGLMPLQMRGIRRNVFILLCNPTTKQHSHAVSARLCGFIQDYSSGLRTWPKNRINPMGSMGLWMERNDRWNRLPCWSSQARPRGDCLANNITRLFGRRLSLRATRVAAVFIRTSYTISRGSITLGEFPFVKTRKSVVFGCENSLHF